MKNVYYIDRTNSLTNKIKSTVGVYNKIIRDLSTELDRLEESEEYYRKRFAELHKRIDDVIDFINDVEKEYIITDFDLDYIRRILNGDDKNENS